MQQRRSTKYGERKKYDLIFIEFDATHAGKRKRGGFQISNESRVRYIRSGARCHRDKRNVEWLSNDIRGRYDNDERKTLMNIEL